MIIRRLEPCDIEIVDELDQTVRGEGGFGSTG
jgi:dUTPase